ncbi:hypothetical protein [Streptomyces californicus]|uniref:hypothetical protein n=1 Tax=Streptomyces californicus TaxID=67351 RepID=UPI0037F3E447
MSDAFSMQMFSLLHISDALIPQMHKPSKAAGNNPISRVADLLNEEEGVEFDGALEWLRVEAEGILKARAARDAKAEGEEDGNPEHVSSKLAVRSPNVTAAFMQFVHDALTGAPRAEDDTLRKSLLVTAVSNFEVLFGKLAEGIYRVNRSALNDSDYSFSLQQLADFETLDDARQFLVERRVAALMRESFDGWDRWLGKVVKGVSMGALPVNWPATREVFARRNVVVHNGGVVNHMYLSANVKLSDRGAIEAKLGARLTVDSEYFSAAVQNLLALGMALVSEVGRKLSKYASHELNQGLLFNADMAVRRKAWIASSALSSYLLSSQLSRASQLRAQMINWVARKGMGELDVVRGEVTKWDASGLSEEFSHYKAVLLGEKEEAIKLVEGLIASDKLALVEVALHPAYAELHDELPSLTARKKAAQDHAGEATTKVVRPKKIAKKPAVAKPQNSAQLEAGTAPCSDQGRSH